MSSLVNTGHSTVTVRLPAGGPARRAGALGTHSLRRQPRRARSRCVALRPDLLAARRPVVWPPVAGAGRASAPRAARRGPPSRAEARRAEPSQAEPSRAPVCFAPRQRCGRCATSLKAPPLEVATERVYAGRRAKLGSARLDGSARLGPISLRCPVGINSAALSLTELPFCVFEFGWGIEFEIF